ncbi:MAG TPA: hypothetical protein PKC67_06825 [Kiritimatiellia bacterium]|nr:hypothetical protein [Kiritimatiellia bacterium]HMP34050.1 hypothetical protein [Kiritimatiellia bacterium]
MKTPYFACFAAMLLVVASFQQASGYVELSDEEMRRLSGGHGTVAWTPEEPLRGGTIYFVTGFSTNDASYYLYLPKAYDGTNDLPAMIFMNAAQHGLGPLLVWMPSVEDLGWIIAVPHSIGNGGPPDTSRLLREINRHFRSTVRHDIRRLYVGGVSGGSCRAYWQARGFRGEYAGVVDVVGWMCDYDEYVYYPRRLAVVHVNGEAYRINSIRSDDRILNRDGVRTRMFNHDGGHHYPEPALADEALAWLNQDFERFGVHFTFPDAELRAAALMAEAEAVSINGTPLAAAPLFMDVLSKFAYTTNAFGAESSLLDLLAQVPAEDAAAAITDAPDIRRLFARLLYQRAAYYDTVYFPADRTRLLSGLAIALDPTNHHALSLHASSLMKKPDRTKQEVQFARSLLEQTMAIGTNYWIGYFNRAELSLLGGELDAANAYLDLALPPARFWYDPFDYNENAINARRADLEREQGNTLVLPWHEYFLDQPTGRFTQATYPGSYVVSGAPAIMNLPGAAGDRALVLAGSNDVVRFNLLHPPTSNLYVSILLKPARGDAAPPVLLYDRNPLAFRIDAQGRVNRYSLEAGLTNWVVLQHDPLDPDSWNILTFSIDASSGLSHTILNGQPAGPAIRLPPAFAMPSYVALESWSGQPIAIDSMVAATTPPPDDLDRDNLPDAWELDTGLQAYVASGGRTDDATGPNGDPDGDGLTNLREFLRGTHPLLADTDGDKMTDGAEIAHGFNPLAADPFHEISLPSGGSFADALADEWNHTGDIRLRTVERADGGSLAEILPSLGDCRLTRYYASGPKTVIWLTLSLQPTPGIDTTFTETMKQGASLVYMNTNGHLVAFDGTPSVRGWITLDQHPFPLDTVIEIRLRLDYRNKTWSIWKDNILLADHLGFANQTKTHFSTITFEGTGLLDTYHVAAHGPDGDRDGVPDDWEMRFFQGLDRVTAESDNDGDGFPDISEYLAGTDPLDPDAHLKILDVTLDGNQLSIVWEAKAENYEGNPISYNLLRSKTMQGGVMTPIAHEIHPKGVRCTYMVSGDPDALSAFYAIEANP